MSDRLWRFTELVLVIVAVLTPQFVLAAKVDGSELAKATAGVAMAGVVVAAYRVWKGVAEARAARRAAAKLFPKSVSGTSDRE